MRIPIALGLAGALLLAGCSSAGALPPPPPLPGLADCAPESDCPPVGPVLLEGEQVPIYETRYEPIYEERRTPVWGEKTVPAYRTRKIPVTISWPDACTGCEKDVRLFDREEQVQVGVRRVPACIGYKTERVVVGHCAKQVRVGWRTAAPEPACPPTPACP